MLTKNFYTWLSTMFSATKGTISGLTYTLFNGTTTTVYCKGSSFSASYSPAYWFKYVLGGKVTTSTNAHGIIFGDGTKEAAIDDYFLSGKQLIPSSTSFGEITSVTSLSADGRSLIVKNTVVYNNGGTEAVTITEVGVMGPVSKDSSTYRSVLVDRTLLDNPVTVEPGGFGEINYTITIPLIGV